MKMTRGTNQGKMERYVYYYAHSRRRLVSQLKEINPGSLIETGCGLGYTTQIIQESLPQCNVVGMDISSIAISTKPL